MNIRKPIESYKVFNDGVRNGIWCKEPEVRKLESDFNISIETLELMEPYLKPSIRKDLKIILEKLKREG